MDEPQTGTTEERLGKLENAVADLQAKLRDLSEALVGRVDLRGHEHTRPTSPGATRRTTERARPDGTAARTPRGVRAAGRRTRRGTEKPAWQRLVDRGPQFWISRLGIGLLLLSVVFLFDYAIDKGWLTPTIRVTIGIALGIALAVIGLRVRRKEAWFSQLMLGGAAATWYITGFAAFQLLHLFSYPVAFSFMVLVTAYTFWAGIREDSAALSVLAAIGAFGTPVFLYTGAGSVPALIGYTCIVLVGTSAIYLVKGWRSLLWTSVFGVWYILLVSQTNAASNDGWALQAGMVFIWLAIWQVSVGRAWLANGDPARWPTPKSRLAAQLSEAGIAVERHGDVALLAAAMPVAALFFSREVWDSGDVLWGAVAVAAALCYAAAARLIRRKPDLNVLVSAHIVAVAILLVIAAALFFDNEPQLLAWSALAVVFLYSAERLDEAALRVCGYLLSVIVAVWLLQRLTTGGPSETAVFTVPGLTDAAVVIGLLVASKWSGNNSAKVYQLGAHAALLGWLWRELAALPGGDAIVTASYGVYGLTLLLASAKTRKVGLVTLLIAVAKLFLVDLDRVDPFLRILLFLGFGALFLAISYYYRDRLTPPRPGAPVE